MNNSVETINAAATAIVAAESRVQQATIQVDRRIFDQELFLFFLFSDFWWWLLRSWWDLCDYVCFEPFLGLDCRDLGWIWVIGLISRLCSNCWSLGWSCVIMFVLELFLGFDCMRLGLVWVIRLISCFFLELMNYWLDLREYVDSELFIGFDCWNLGLICMINFDFVVSLGSDGLNPWWNLLCRSDSWDLGWICGIGGFRAFLVKYLFFEWF